MKIVYHDERMKQLHPIYKSILHVMKIDFDTGVVAIGNVFVYISSFTFH